MGCTGWQGPGILHPCTEAVHITESQNHRMVGVGRDLCGSSNPTPLPKQGHPEQAAQDLVQAGLEYLLRRRLHSLPGQPGPGLHHPHSVKACSLVTAQALQPVSPGQVWGSAPSLGTWPRSMAPYSADAVFSLLPLGSPLPWHQSHTVHLPSHWKSPGDPLCQLPPSIGHLVSRGSMTCSSCRYWAPQLRHPRAEGVLHTKARSCGCRQEHGALLQPLHHCLRARGADRALLLPWQGAGSILQAGTSPWGQLDWAICCLSSALAQPISPNRLLPPHLAALIISRLMGKDLPAVFHDSVGLR